MAAEEKGAEGLKLLVSHAGGQVAARAPKTGAAGKWLVLGSQDVKKDKAWAAKTLPAGTIVHNRSFLVDSILQQALDERQGVLFTV